MAKGLRSIGINKIIPAQIDFTQITSGSAAGPGSFVALSSDGTPVLVDIASYYEELGFGDIEGVTAGNGLTGGGTAGTVTLNVGSGTGISVAADSISTNDSEIIHDNLSGFVSDEHVAHSTVSITAGNGLTGGGTIAATRTIDVGAGTGISVAADSISTNDSEIVHDNLSGFVSDEHIAHSTVSITAGSGLTGGGTIAATRTINIGAGTGITVNADDIQTNDSEIVHDNLSGFVSDEHVAHSTVSITAGSGLTGGGTIAATRTINIGEGTGISVAADSISTNDSEIVHDNLSGFVSDEHVAHSTVSITAGNGLTGGGTIAATRTINVGAGTGITVASDSISFDPDGGTLTTLNSSVDHILINDGGVFKRIAPSNVNISSFNNDSGFTSNTGDITGVTAGNGLTGGGSSGAVTLNIGEGVGIMVAADSISVDVSDFMTNGVDNRVLTATSADSMNAEANLTFDGSTLECNATLRVSQYISHIGDTDTSIQFTDDKIVLDAGGVEMITITESTQDSVVINEGGGDVDFRVESDEIAYAFWVRGSDGRVGIGDSAPEGKVHIKQAADGSGDNYAGDALVIENVNSSEKWYIGIDNDNDLVFAYGNPNQATAGGYLQGGVDVNNIDFTGQHRSVPSSGSVNEYSDKIGMIVVSTGEYYNHSGATNTIDSALPKICLSSVAKDKSVYGVVSSITDENSDNQTYNLGTFGTMFPKSEDRVIVNALGEGSIWVTNINGNFENGDYITTSTIPGYGMKQDDDLLHNYTAAKITQDCNFDLNSTYDCEEFEYNGVTYRRAFVGCTYHCG